MLGLAGTLRSRVSGSSDGERRHPVEQALSPETLALVALQQVGCSGKILPRNPMERQPAISQLAHDVVVHPWLVWLQICLLMER